MFGKKFEKEILVKGMKCGHCAKKVEDTLSKINSVKKVIADFNSGKVKIISKAEIENTTLNTAVESLGYIIESFI